ncbi:MAG: metallophosphoesterase family protein [Nitrososphaeraceae archaeon]
MKIGLRSDTHDKIQNIQNAISLFNDKRVNFVIHAGDMVSQPFFLTRTTYCRC